MIRRMAALLVLALFVLSLTQGGTPSGTKKEWFRITLPSEEATHGPTEIHAVPVETAPMRVAGIYTGLTGFFDFQVNAGACQYIRVDPADPTGNTIHVIMMQNPDSTGTPFPMRGTYYAMSTNGGATWNTFNQIRIPERRSGYPSLDLLQGSLQAVVVANHNVQTVELISFVYVDTPPGSGIFAELPPPGELFGTDERIWPHIAGASDGSIVMSASRQTARTCFGTRTSDYTSWSSWFSINPTGSAGLPTKANTTGRVGILHNTSFGTGEGVFFYESTNNGATWPANGQLIFPTARIAGQDTFDFTLGSDFVYRGNNPLFAVAEGNIGLNAPTDSAQITFWSSATGFVPAATKVNTPGVAPFENLPTLNCITMDMPSIGLSGSNIVIAYQAMMNNDLALNGYNNNDIFMVFSTDGGFTWSTPRNLSQSTGLDDRFVSVSPWNEPGFVNLVWQEDTQAGGNVIADPGAGIARTRQVFLKTPLGGVDVNEGDTRPASFQLDQNYPNPFNPSTTISFALPERTHVVLTVFSVLGQEVARVVDGIRERGRHEVTFPAEKLGSGVYFYTLRAGADGENGSFIESRKMVLVR